MISTSTSVFLKQRRDHQQDRFILRTMSGQGSRITWQLFPRLSWIKRIIYSTPYMNGRATALGVFKAYVVFFSRFLQVLLYSTCWLRHSMLFPGYLMGWSSLGYLWKGSKHLCNFGTWTGENITPLTQVCQLLSIDKHFWAHLCILHGGLMCIAFCLSARLSVYLCLSLNTL